MTSQINTKDFIEWCKVPVDQLENHPDAKIKIKILEKPEDVLYWAARELANEVKLNNADGKPTCWILPCGPTGQYPIFADIVNSERISLRNVHVFHMDDYLDWQGRHLPEDHIFSFKGTMTRIFYDPIAPELAVPRNQRHFPSIYALEKLSQELAEVGGADSMYSGIGYRGHIAYNEPPIEPWHTIRPEEFRNSKTRILRLNVDTIIAMSHRVTGGLTHIIPPMAITMGMKDLLSAKKLRLISITGAWKRAIIRYLVFGPTTIEFPVTFVQEHPDVMLVVDRNTALSPIEVSGG